MALYRTSGTCSREIMFSLDENNFITQVKFIGGCSGNLQGISKLITGRKAEEIIPLIKGIKCRNNTSCPDQLALALEEYLKKNS